MPWLTLFKFRDVGYLLVIGLLVGYIGWLKYEIAGEEARQLKAIAAANEKARISSDRIIAEQQVKILSLADKTNTYTTEIKYVPITTQCAASPSMQRASIGVRDILSGSKPQAK